ncbi:MAG: hypothetical protein LBF74_12730, partial [Treponema sp.]|nr:hypothetical protein [Treponema sp.]
STGGGALIGLVQGKLGSAAGFIGKKTGAPALQQALSQKITGLLSNRLHLSGTWVQIATGPIGKILMEGAGEFAEEGIERLIENTTVELAKLIQKEGIEVTPEYQGLLTGVVGDGFGGFVVGTILAPLGLGVDAVIKMVSTAKGNITAEDAQKIKDLAESTADAEEFVKKVREAGITSVSDESLEEIKAAANQKREEAEAAEQEAVKKPRIPRPTEEGPAPARRRGGRLAVRLAEGALSDDWTETHHMTINDPSDGGLYGQIDFRRGENGDIVIDDIQVQDYLTDRDAVIRDAVKELGYNFPGSRIDWNPEGVEDQEIRDRLEEHRPHGEDLGLNWFRTRRDFKTAEREAAQQEWIAEAAPHIAPEERQTAYEVAGLLARARGETAEEWGRRVEFTNTLTAEQQERIGAKAAQRSGKTIKGATFDWTDIEGKTKRYVYLSRNADFSTLNHELFHDHILSLSDEQRAEWEEALGIRDGDWDAERFEGKDGKRISAHEYAAEAFEDYLTERKEPPSAKLKALFDRIIEFMRRIYGTLRDLNGIKPELRKKFDEIFSREEGGGETEYEAEINRRIDELNREGRERAQEMVREREEKTARDWTEETARDWAEKTAREEGGSGEPLGEVVFQRGDETNPIEALINRSGALLEDLGERERVIKELRELERLYPPETNQYRAPNGEPSLLLETLGEEQGREAWYAVRTPSFKEWFGDWERLARIEGIEKSKPVKVTVNTPVSQKEAETIAGTFGTLQNQSDGKPTELPITTIGKIIYHQGFDISRIIRDIPVLYTTSKQAWAEPEILQKGHKRHPNIKEYRHYVNKFTDGTDEYYIRFTVTEENTKPGKTGRNLIHSSAISEVSIYKNGDDSQRNRLKVPGETKTPPFIDIKLKQFFDSVNPSEVS